MASPAQTRFGRINSLASPRASSTPRFLDLLARTVETTFPRPPEFVAQGDRVMVVGFATGKVKATNKTFDDDWIFDITVRNGKATNIREYVDTQALARAARPTP